MLHRLIGSRKIMYDQLLHLADTSCHPSITVQIVPAAVGTHAGLLGGFVVASVGSAPGILYTESADSGQTIKKPALAAKQR